MLKNVLLSIVFIVIAKTALAQGKDTLGVVVKEPAAVNKDSLYVFIGKQISIKQFKLTDTALHTDPETGAKYRNIYMDASFNAKYKIVKDVFNHFDNGTIDFVAYDHYGKPAFSRSKYSLLFVTRIHGKFYHIKYLYFKVYETEDGKWASACDPGSVGFVNDYKQLRDKAVSIKFKNPVVFNLSGILPDKIDMYFYAPYFKIEEGKATALMGVYADDLFKIAADGILRERGYFK